MADGEDNMLIEEVCTIQQQQILLVFSTETFLCRTNCRCGDEIATAMMCAH